MIERPTQTSAAATTIIKNTNNCPSIPAVELEFAASAFSFCILENATNKRLTAFNMSSIHIKIMIAFLRVNTPTTPIQNKKNASVI
jgi:hypothetical protein